MKTNVSSEEGVCSIRVDKSPGHLNIVCATHTEQTSWKNESVVKILYSQDATCLIQTKLEPVHAVKSNLRLSKKNEMIVT